MYSFIVVLISNFNLSDLCFCPALGPFRWYRFGGVELATLDLPDVARPKRLIISGKRAKEALGHKDGAVGLFSDDVTAAILEIDGDFDTLQRLAPLVFELECYARNPPFERAFKIASLEVVEPYFVDVLRVCCLTGGFS